jgi:hypothetical protein
MSKDGIKLGRRSKKFKQNLSNVVANCETTTVCSINDNKISKLGQTYPTPAQTSPKSHEVLTTSTKSESSPKTEAKADLDNKNQQIFAILQDNKLIIKAIDILSAVSAAAASATNSLTNNNNVQQPPPQQQQQCNNNNTNNTNNLQQLVLSNNLNILNNTNLGNNDGTQNSNSQSNSSINSNNSTITSTTTTPSAQFLTQSLAFCKQTDANNNQAVKLLKFDQNGSFIGKQKNTLKPVTFDK